VPPEEAPEPPDDDLSMLVQARRGLLELAFAGRALLRDPGVLDDIGGHRARLASAAGLLVAVGVGANVLARVAPLDVEGAAGWQQLLGWVLHPALLPAIVLGLYLRQNVAFETDRRLRAQAETRQKALALWEDAAPQIVAVYAVATLAVALLATARLNGVEGGTLADSVDDASTGLIVCVWILAPLAHARAPGLVPGLAIEAAIGAIVSLMIMHLTLMIASMGTGIVVGILVSLLPLPEASAPALSLPFTVAAALGFLALMLGYTFAVERDRFLDRLTEVEETGA
jgi:hypothetical protein